MWKNGVVFFLSHFLLLLSLGEVGNGLSNLRYSRDDFPSSFVFGAGTSAYQVEGAAAEDGRTPSIWDTYTHSGKMADNSTGDIASDGYHRYKEDVKLMADTGLEAYRFSISWSRLLPNGRGAVNPKGLAYYNNLIDELVKHGIKPHVTLYHLDLPQVLQDEYGGWLSPKIIDDFRGYADACFREFGDRVDQWTTTVEPNVVSQAAYDSGFFPPERCSYPFGLTNCSAGNSTVEPYISTHIILLTHAAVFNLYKTKYQAEQKGQVGINLYSVWLYPFSNSSADVEATRRVMDFMIGWFLHPLIFGDYPEVMKKIVGPRLPSFTETEAAQVKGSFDFIGLNHYTSVYVKDTSTGTRTALRDYTADMLAELVVSRNSSAPFVPTLITSDPRGLSKMLAYLKEAYGNPPIYIEENGRGSQREVATLEDTERIDYLSAYIGRTLDAIRNGSNVQGYFVWSFLDVFEFLLGYQASYGLYYVDFEDGSLKRQPKLSAHWYSNFLKTRTKEISMKKKDGLQETSRSSL